MMKYQLGAILFRVLIFFILVISVSPITAYSQSSISLNERMEIREISNKYQDAIKSSRGINVLPLVSENSIRFYEKVRNLALWAEQEELMKEEIYVIIETIFIREVLSYSELRSMDGKDLIVDSYSGQTSTLNEGENLKIENITKVDRNRVVVNYTSNYNNTIDLAYIKENGEWRVNLEDQKSLTYFDLQVLFTQAEQEGYDKTFFINYVLDEVFKVDKSGLLSPLVSQQ